MEMACARCKREMVKLKSGYDISQYPKDSFKPVVYRGDLFECKQCGARMYGAFGSRHTTDNHDKIIWIDQE